MILWPKSFKNCTADSLIGPKVSNRGVNFGGRGDTSPRIWSGEKNSLKLGQNYAYRNPKLLQLLGDFVPPDPMHRTSPTFCTRFTPLHENDCITVHYEDTMRTVNYEDLYFHVITLCSLDVTVNFLGK